MTALRISLLILIASSFVAAHSCLRFLAKGHAVSSGGARFGILLIPAVLFFICAGVTASQNYHTEVLDMLKPIDSNGHFSPCGFAAVSAFGWWLYPPLHFAHESSSECESFFESKFKFLWVTSFFCIVIAACYDNRLKYGVDLKGLLIAECVLLGVIFAMIVAEAIYLGVKRCNNEIRANTNEMNRASSIDPERFVKSHNLPAWLNADMISSVEHDVNMRCFKFYI